jgi:hypothetical protein
VIDTQVWGVFIATKTWQNCKSAIFSNGGGSIGGPPLRENVREELFKFA